MIAPKTRLVAISSADGITLAQFWTDRETFPAIATFGRDRVFGLAHDGSFGRDVLGDEVHGAIYVEVDAWRINMKTLDKPSRFRRRRKPQPSAVILPFPNGMEGAS